MSRGEHCEKTHQEQPNESHFPENKTKQKIRHYFLAHVNNICGAVEELKTLPQPSNVETIN